MRVFGAESPPTTGFFGPSTFFKNTKCADLPSPLYSHSLLTAFVIPVIPFFHRDVFRVFRVMMHCALASGPIFMAIHAVRLWGSDSPVFTILFHKIFLSYSLYALGIVFYISRFPERLFPGRFDLLGASHQFWHIFVVLAAYATYSGLLDISEHPFATTCSIMNDMM